MQRTILLTLLFSLATANVFAIDIARDGKSLCTIVVAEDAQASDKTAARDLKKYLQRVTGATFEVKPSVDEATPAIFVGVSPRVKQLLPKVSFDSLGPDAIVIDTPDENHLVLAGEGTRGTLYAVETFLEDQVGVRWWTGDEETVPHTPTLHASDLHAVYTPPLRYRESFHNHLTGKQNAEIAAHLKLNGHHHKIPAEWGGHYTLIGWCHTSYELIPPGNYFTAHPEWFSERKGKRDPNAGQLCWSNSELQKEVAKNALKLIRKNPDAGMISISQNDQLGWCECDTCKAIDDANGGAHSASLITGINAIAGIIQKEYPSFLVETLAYQYTRKAPTDVKPADNVLVRLCSIECDFAHPLSADQNKSFGDDLRAWAKRAKNLFIWNYTTNFSNYLIPQPNLNATADDLRFFAGNKVVGVFEQADDYNHLAGDMLPLRGWLQAHLMWDPSRDQQQLIDEFLAGYFGAAGKPLGEYLKVVNARSSESGFRRGCYHRDPDFLTPDSLSKCNQLFDEAENAVAKDDVLLQRVKRERVVLEHANLLTYDFVHAITQMQAERQSPEDAANMVCKDFAERAHEFVVDATKRGVRNLGEGRGFDNYEQVLLNRSDQYLPIEIPKAGEPGTKGAVDLQQDRFELFKPGKLSELVDDAKASDGKAACMPGGQTQWAVQFHVPKDSKEFAGGPWRVFFIVRIDGHTDTGEAFRYGLQDTDRGQLGTERAPMSTAKDEEYHVYSLRVATLKPGMYFWVSPTTSPAIKSVYVDRIYVVPAKSK